MVTDCTIMLGKAKAVRGKKILFGLKMISYKIFIELIFHLYSENKINVRSLLLNEAVLIKCKIRLKWVINAIYSGLS